MTKKEKQEDGYLKFLSLVDEILRDPSLNTESRYLKVLDIVSSDTKRIERKLADLERRCSCRNGRL